ncbi:phosphoglycerate mutase-like protein [Ascodesmis nigricans]|uniref:Phosphoglycerate mutase-like protein n=1 Tax=Ascodesmis nigricans TaxID=341454 RepID=A0A4S2N457_9PEZI|nr:phosphoglycerate mutase-like protein [Ascodesmis nigricans]
MQLIASLPLLLSLLPFGAAHHSDETVHAAVIFHRHTDRTWKSAPPTRLTTLGQTQAYKSGRYWAKRYLDASSDHQILGISPSTYNPADLKVYAPDEPVLVTTGQSFLQGLYPPSSAAAETLANGTKLEAPLEGYQYAALHTVQKDSPEAIWLKGDDSCPAHDAVEDVFEVSSSEESDTKAFYESFYDRVFSGVMDKSKLSFSNAFAVFDYVNVGITRNETIAKAVSSDELAKLQYLASRAEFALNGDIASTTDIRAISGRTLARRVLDQLTLAISTKGLKEKFFISVGSYDTFLSFFAIVGLPAFKDEFRNLPNLGSVMAFEVLSYGQQSSLPAEKELFIRFLFRNGTEDTSAATATPLFSTSSWDAIIPWATFQEKMGAIAIKGLDEWCNLCKSQQLFCNAYYPAGVTVGSLNKGSNGLSAPVAGIVGGVIVLGVMSLLTLAALFLGLRVTRKRKLPAAKTLDDASSIEKA